jgi:hypothetical protein
LKAGVVAAGYAAALLVAAVTVAGYVHTTNGPDRQSYGGMYAFGDSLLFLAVFAVAALPATGVALYFLRPQRWFWRTLSFAMIAVAVTGAAAALEYLRAQGAGPSPDSWSALAVLRILVAPMLVPGVVLAAVLAPDRSPRIALLAAAIVEAAAFASVAVGWVAQIVSR